MGVAYDRHRDDPEAPWNRVPRTRGRRRNTRDWCRGKEGVPHQYAVALPTNERPCWASTIFNRETRDHEPRWLCNHELVCGGCGKIDRSYEGDCPDRPAEIPLFTRWWKR